MEKLPFIIATILVLTFLFWRFFGFKKNEIIHNLQNPVLTIIINLLMWFGLAYFGYSLRKKVENKLNLVGEVEFIFNWDFIIYFTGIFLLLAAASGLITFFLTFFLMKPFKLKIDSFLGSKPVLFEEVNRKRVLKTFLILIHFTLSNLIFYFLVINFYQCAYCDGFLGMNKFVLENSENPFLIRKYWLITVWIVSRLLPLLFLWALYNNYYNWRRLDTNSENIRFR